MKKSRKSEKFSFVAIYLKTILQIIEDKPNFLIPVPFYCILIIIYYLQLSGYIYSHYESKKLEEGKFGYLAYLNEVSPVTFLLYMRGNDTLTLIVYFIMQFVMYFYFIYVGVLGWFRYKHQWIADKYKRLFQQINQILNIFFTFYWWVFFTPYVEINSGIIVCSGNSFLTKYRDGNCDKPIYLFIMGAVGLLLSVITGLIIIFFFRSYEFDEGNLLKRRYNFLLVAQLFTRFMTTFFYYLNIDIVLVFKHVAGQFVALSLMYDIIYNWPFRHKFVSRFYVISTVCYWWAMTVCALWMFTDEFPSDVLFYPLIIIAVVLSGLFMVCYNSRYDMIMKFEHKKFDQLYKYLDFYLEELHRLLIDSLRDERAKYQLFEIIAYHMPICIDSKCSCKTHSFFNSQNEIEVEHLYLFIDSIFKWALQQPILKKNRDEYEHLSLKYISYLGKFRNNANRAYLELKKLLSNRNDVSFYFKTISTISSINIEFMMEQIYIRNQLQNNNFGNNHELNAQILLKLQTFKFHTIPQVADFLQKKIKFWNTMRLGFSTMNDYLTTCLELSSVGDRLRQQLEFELNNFEEKNNIVYLRIRSIYYSLIMKELSTAWKDEQQILELKKRDMGKDLRAINNVSLADGNIVNVIISMTKPRGKIMSKVSPKIAQFFNYSYKEFETINNIKQLMPPFIGKIHDKLMKNTIRRGKSIYIKSKLSAFIYDKQKFIIPCYSYLDHNFSFANEFCINATILKVQDSINYLMFNRQGQILGISKELYKKLFLKEEFKSTIVQLNKHTSQDPMQSIRQNQQSSQMKIDPTKDIQVQTVYQKYLIQFLIPQLLKIFQDIDFKYDPKQKLFEHQLLQQQPCRIKIPNEIQQIQEECNQFLMEDMVSHSSHYSQQNSKSYSTSNIESIKFQQSLQYYDFMSQQQNSKVQNFIMENRDNFKTRKCISDWSAKVDLLMTNVLYGENFSNNSTYFILQIKDLNPAQDSHSQDNASNFWMSQYETTFGMSMKSKFKSSLHSGTAENSTVRFRQQNKSTDPHDTEEIDDQIANNLVGTQQSTDRNQPSKRIQLKQQETIPEASQEDVNLNAASDSNLQSTKKSKKKHLQNLEEPKLEISAIPVNDQSKVDMSQNISVFDQFDQSHQNLVPLESHLPSPLIKSQEFEDKDNKYLGDYQPTNNQQLKSGEISMLKTPEGSDNGEQVINTQEEDHIDSQDQKYHENSDSEHSQNQDDDKLTQSLFQKVSQYDKKSQENLDEDEEDEERQSLKESKQSSKNKDKKENHQTRSIRRIYQKRQKQDNNLNIAQSQSSQSTRRNNLNNEILRELFGSHSQPRSVMIFKKLMSLFIFIFIILVLIFILAFVPKLNDLSKKLKLQMFPAELNIAYQQQNLLTLALIEAKQNALKDPQSSALIPYFKELYKNGTSEYLRVREKHSYDLHSLQETKFKDYVLTQIYVDGVKREQNLKISEFFDLMLNSMYQQYEKLQNTVYQIGDEFLTMLENMEPHYNLTLEIGRNYEKQTKDAQSQIYSQYIIFTVFVLSIYFLISVAMYPLLKRISKYQEKILFVVSRIYEYESQIEIAKLQECWKELQSPDEEWLNTNFVEIVLTEEFNEIKEKNQNSNLLQSKIGTQNLQSWKQSVILLITSVVISLFFAVIIIIVAQSNKNLEPSVEFNSLSYENSQTLTVQLSLSELLISEHLVRKEIPYSPDFNLKQYYSIVQNQMVDINGYLSSFQKKFQKSTVLKQSTINQVNNLYKNDLCQSVDCNTIVFETQKDYVGGLVGSMSFYVSNLIQYDYIFNPESEISDQKREEETTTYINQDSHLEYILQAYSVIIPAQKKILEVILKANIDIVESTEILCLVYFLSLGIVMGIISTLLYFVMNYYLSKRMREIHFLLSAIPHDKLQDDATNYILKGISKL